MGVRHARPFAVRTPGGEQAWREALPEPPDPRDHRLWSARLPRVAWAPRIEVVDILHRRLR